MEIDTTLPHTPFLLILAESPSRNIFHLDLISTGCRSQSSAQFLSGDQEPWAFRGGLAGEFQVSYIEFTAKC